MIERYLAVADVTPERITSWQEALERSADRFDIAEPARLIPWLATLVHESAGFAQLVENLNYSPQALCAVWPQTPRRPWGFTASEAVQYAHQPQRIANRVYADRMGNGNEATGEGWRFRGRGPLQITGRDNYAALTDALEVDLLADPDALVAPSIGARAAGWWWQQHGCNELADGGDLTAVRQRVNGGTLGLAEFVALVEKMRAA